MAYSGLPGFIRTLEKDNELQRIKEFVSPILEIAEVTDRVTKAGGKALLFENTGTKFPLLINSFGSDKRMKIALGVTDLNQTAEKTKKIFDMIMTGSNRPSKVISTLFSIMKLAGYLPVRVRKKGLCQQIIHNEPDLSILPVLKCWPHDGGRFITLPMVHTMHPGTGSSNVGMYRVQILDKKSVILHWQRHKTGANHYDEWKKIDERMPVAVALGGDPVYAYSATAPLPENINEYLFAGLLREKKVKLVKCITNDLYVPYDADIVIEGYVDPSEELTLEGPFGDHTGFYSLADWYPKMHVTCITHSLKAIYPATIVGIPPQEDVWMTKATEKIFLYPVKLVLQPEIEDFHMPEAGTAHNLVLVKIIKKYPGQGMKIINSLFGAGQLMFTKYLIVVSGNVDIRDYKEFVSYVFDNTRFEYDILFSYGPLDVLDHSSGNPSFGGKAGVDATVKLREEGYNVNDKNNKSSFSDKSYYDNVNKWFEGSAVKEISLFFPEMNKGIMIASVDINTDAGCIDKIAETVKIKDIHSCIRIVLVVDDGVDTEDLYNVVWLVLANSDPCRDHRFISSRTVLIDGTIKLLRNGNFPRKWPNVVCSSQETIKCIDKKWEFLNCGEFIPSPSLKNMRLCRAGNAEIDIPGENEMKL